ncbi:hypothetical protein AXJ18_gp115 [Streptomyces phage Jay2Jay]|uniref:Uncharacterized protein n=2 Tax=Samistivirus jay2jay TaxID=2560786 RepID=A0A221SB53_9CAUD|nr:hypothetical protein AXJ18_gp115 [Streptomyces phage Jay2Jay]AIW02659.1 hypothetical protein PBI_JAY2JAY_201 [Streptomyces phage Jay2Jay]ASN73234.1 hypothetical protein SEA_WARPY_199 [Streptomyces phage Warpy]UEM46945.1 hypothetical protein SEA_TARGARYEN_195 [Streptomyces phage Targaryen]
MRNIFREAAQKAVSEGICTPGIGCGQPIREEDFTDDVSRREADISGLCQSCQDRIYALMEEGADEPY